jgi:hypothetical protein
MEQASSQNPCLKKFLDELQKEISNPLHKRLIQAYGGSEPVKSMESELAKIISEILRHED